LNPDQRTFQAGAPVEIVVEVVNEGRGRAGPFWVDLFINPSTPPTAANTIWDKTCRLSPCFGIAWGATSGLAPGERLVLTSRPGSYAAPYTRWPGWLASGTSDLYVYADSWKPGSATGAVAETNESNNRAELRGLSVTGTNPGTSNAAEEIPDRPTP
jgi:hypothetical protein